MGRVAPPSLFDRRLALWQLRRRDEADRGDHRQARGQDDARARRVSQRRTRAVAGPRATGVRRLVTLARRRAVCAGRRRHPTSGLRVDRGLHRDGSVHLEIELHAAATGGHPPGRATRGSATTLRRREHLGGHRGCQRTHAPSSDSDSANVPSVASACRCTNNPAGRTEQERAQQRHRASTVAEKRAPTTTTIGDGPPPSPPHACGGCGGSGSDCYCCACSAGGVAVFGAGLNASLTSSTPCSQSVLTSVGCTSLRFRYQYCSVSAPTECRM